MKRDNSMAQSVKDGKLMKPTREFTDFFYWLKNELNFYPDICLDVGAAWGTPAMSRSFPKAKHIAFEPIPSFIPKLKEELADLDHEIYQMGLMEEPGVMKITLPENLYTATLMSKNTNSSKMLDVEVSTLDLVLKKTLEGKKVLLKTDCQGGDLAVIKGGKKNIQNCDVIIMETSLYRFWGDHHPDFYDIVSYMKSEGFVVIDILGGLFKPNNRALGQVDLAFVKENGPLRPDHSW